MKDPWPSQSFWESGPGYQLQRGRVEHPEIAQYHCLRLLFISDLCNNTSCTDWASSADGDAWKHSYVSTKPALAISIEVCCVRSCYVFASPSMQTAVVFRLESRVNWATSQRLGDTYQQSSPITIGLPDSGPSRPIRTAGSRGCEPE